MIDNLSDLYPEQYRDCIYDALQFMPNALCVDVGAADGQVAKKIRAASNDMTLVAFEPFPGNHGFFETRFAGDENVILEKMAISDKEGEATFVVPQIVAGWEPGWEKQAGYSSTGFLASVRSSTSYWDRLRKGGLKKLLKQLMRGERPQIVKVQTTTLDKYFEGREIDFCKIDTQGAEYHVLKGAEALFEESALKMVYVEYEDNADEAIVSLLEEKGYKIFASVFVIYGSVSSIDKSLGLEPIHEMKLSNGYTATAARLRAGKSADECINWLRRSAIRFHNDLVAVSPDRLPDLEEAMNKLSAQPMVDS